MTRRVRVLHTIQNLNYGGMERLLADIVRRSDASEFEFHVMCYEYLGRYAKELEDVATLHLVRPTPKVSLLWPRKIVRAIREIEPDVLHSHSGVWHKSGLSASWAGVPLVIHTEHGRHVPDPWHHRFLDGLGSSRTDIVVAVSAELAHRLRAEVIRADARIEVITNGVDTDLHRPRPDDGTVRAELGISPDVPVIGSVGRLVPVKGYDVMLRALQNLSDRWPAGQPEPVLVVAGEGVERSKLQALATDLGIRDRVHLLGWRDDIARLHAMFDLFTMSSRSEGTSVSLLEAMSAGLCPVVTRVGGNETVLAPELEHRLVPSEDPEALAATWLRALLTARRGVADGRTARRLVERRFSLDRMVGQYERLYAEARARPGLSRRGSPNGLRSPTGS